MVDETQSQEVLHESEIEPASIDPHWRAIGALQSLADNPERALRIESNPNPMYATVEDSELVFWCFDYSKKCQVQDDVTESKTFTAENAADMVHIYAHREYGFSFTDRGEIKTEPEPRGTTLRSFGSEQEAEQ
ncbi:hypothetical protein [Halomarina oriensis]|uniref:Uncharacterized protein n=1 Tax=Halomarina oriensis TaxID=671145 RepID=A0A6B0GNS5_9EURY|nr:hypothetical protein [Halomarina oriensis]MWG36576.1 hypothetical protein [Halomarina oriensis]